MSHKNKFDYVIVGGGSAGAALASRLSENPQISVCLLEAGGKGNSLLVRMPAGVVGMIGGHLKRFNWAFETVPQKMLGGRKGYQPRGKGLGGCSAINAMLYVRGHPSDYDEWAALGCDGWAYQDVLPYFKKSENNSRGRDAFHGTNGPLQVRDQAAPNTIARDFVLAAKECGYPENDDFNGKDQQGAGLFQITQFFSGKRNGERCSSAAAYLHPIADRPNLTVITHAYVTKINFKDNKAQGVVYSKSGRQQEITANCEVIVSAGALQSPQLLMLSGIGPAEQLRKHDIDIVKDLPGVGENLRDHINIYLTYKSTVKDLVGISFFSVLPLLKCLVDWLTPGKVGGLSTPFAEAGAFIKTDPEISRPDSQLYLAIGMTDDHLRKLPLGYGYSCGACVLRPYSVGRVTLKSNRPTDPPLIDPKFLEDHRDLDLLVKALKKMREILNSPALVKYKGRELRTENIVTDEQWRKYIAAYADTVYHPVGTCKMGNDPLAVVDPMLRVHGVEGLRVVDASIMPTIIGGNTNATAIMIGEKAADMILSELD